MDDPVLLSRLQFAITIMFHYIFPPMTIGLGVVLVALEGLWLKTKNDLYHKQAKFWTRIFGIIFALGVASGIVMEFQFGTNWADYSRCVGDIFGSPLAAEGIFAFFLESGFLAILLFGWDKVGPKMHFLSSLESLPSPSLSNFFRMAAFLASWAFLTSACRTAISSSESFPSLSVSYLANTSSSPTIMIPGSILFI